MLDPSEGRLLYQGERTTEARHLRARFVLDDGRELWFTDPRRFGEAFLIDDADLPARFAGRVGVEPLSPEFTPEALGAMAAGRTAPLKSFLLDQAGVAGVGNIYADEALYRARLHPLSPAGSMKPEHLEALRDAVVAALEAGIDAGGSSIDDYRDGRGEKGTMQERVPRPHPRGPALPDPAAARSSASSSAGAPPTSARAARCGCAANLAGRRNAAPNEVDGPQIQGELVFEAHQHPEARRAWARNRPVRRSPLISCPEPRSRRRRSSCAASATARRIASSISTRRRGGASARSRRARASRNPASAAAWSRSSGSTSSSTKAAATC